MHVLRWFRRVPAVDAQFRPAPTPEGEAAPHCCFAVRGDRMRMERPHFCSGIQEINSIFYFILVILSFFFIPEVPVAQGVPPPAA